MMIPVNVSFAQTASIINPDKDAINNKKVIDISLTNFDVSASSYINNIALNFDQTGFVTYDDGVTTSRGDVYFTPLYTEKISYEEWLNTINKSFQELEAL